MNKDDGRFDSFRRAQLGFFSHGILQAVYSGDVSELRGVATWRPGLTVPDLDDGGKSKWYSRHLLEPDGFVIASVPSFENFEAIRLPFHMLERHAVSLEALQRSVASAKLPNSRSPRWESALDSFQRAKVTGPHSDLLPLILLNLAGASTSEFQPSFALATREGSRLHFLVEQQQSEILVKLPDPAFQTKKPFSGSDSGH